MTLHPTIGAAAALLGTALLAGPAFAILPEIEDEEPAASAPAATAGSLYEARALVEAGRYAEAVPMLQALAAASPTDADTLTVLGYALRKSGDLDGSLSAYLRALYHDPGHVEAHEYLGELYLMRGDRAAAENELVTLQQLCPAGCEAREELETALENQ